MKKLLLICTSIFLSAMSFGTTIDFSVDSIKLAKPNLTSGKTIMESLSERRSSREFASTPLTLEEVSEVLWAANGINRDDGKRTSPSAMGVHSLEIYVVFEGGIYKYDPLEETITLITEGDHRNLAGLQDFVYSAPLNLIYIMDISKYDRFSNLTREEKISLASQDAATSAQNVSLYAAGKELKAIIRMGARGDELITVLNLDSDRYKFVLAQTVGK